MIRRTEITVETQRLLVIRKGGGAIRAWCEGCRAEVDMIAPHEAAVITNLSSRTIYRWIEEARLHFRESAGVLHVCANSLIANHDETATAPEEAIVKYHETLR